MKAAPFDYFAPESLQEALELLGEHRGSAKVLAGGQSLVPLMAFRMVRPSVVIDLRNVKSLSAYDLTDDTLTIGSMVTHRAVELDQRTISKCSMLEEALAVVGHVAIRNVGTVGGSLAHADPAAEWPTVALALDAEMTIASSSGLRVVRADEFVTGWMTTCMADDEILTAVEMRLPGSNTGTGSAFEEVARRHGDFAIVGAAAVVSVDDSVVSAVRIALGGVAMTPMGPTAAESLLVGRSLSSIELAEVGDAAAAETNPISDLHGSVSYKRRLAAVLTRRVVSRAYERALVAV